MLLVLALSSAAAAWYPGEQQWMCGFIAGALTAIWVALRQSPPGIVERWQEGAWGEEFTARELAKLDEQEWAVLHDLKLNRGNVDHVVVGPAGAFSLNSKKSSAVLQVRDGQLLMSNRYDEEMTWRDSKMLPRARREAAAVARLVRERSGQRIWVQPVLVWWGTFEQQGCVVDGVAVVRGDELASRLPFAAKVQPRPTSDPRSIAAALAPGRRRTAQSATH